MTSFLKNFIYQTIRLFLGIGFKFTYRHIITSGYRRVRKRKPAIFVANHQNTFMDGFLMVYTAGKSNPFILVRADIFKSSFSKIFLNIIKLMPIYRKRDGHNNMSQNEQIFEQCIEIFEKKNTVALFPEGNHALPRRLRPLQKGAARIAFQAEARHDFHLNLSVIPVGLQYENHTDRWHDAHIHYNDFIHVQDFQQLYEENHHNSYQELTQVIQAGISSQMIDIKEEDDLLFFEQIRILMKEVNAEKATERVSLVHHENNMINKLSVLFKKEPAKENDLKTKLNNCILKLRDLGINTDYGLKKPSIVKLVLRSLLLIILSPFYLPFKLLTFIPEWIIEKLIIDKIKDITWHLSIRFAVAAFLYPILYGLVWVVLALTMDNILAAMIIFSFPLFNIIGLEWKHYFKLLKNQWILFSNKKLLSEKEALLKEFIELRGG